MHIYIYIPEVARRNADEVIEILSYLLKKWETVEHARAFWAFWYPRASQLRAARRPGTYWSILSVLESPAASWPRAARWSTLEHAEHFDNLVHPSRARPGCSRTLQDAQCAPVCSRATRRAQLGCSRISERSECSSMLHCFSLVEQMT